MKSELEEDYKNSETKQSNLQYLKQQIEDFIENIENDNNDENISEEVNPGKRRLVNSLHRFIVNLANNHNWNSLGLRLRNIIESCLFYPNSKY